MNVAHLKIVKPSTKPEKTTQTTVDTIMFTPEIVKQWKAPPFQRPLRVTEKLLAIVEQIKTDGGVMPGIITLGVFNGDMYIVDGQHRLEGFKLSELPEGFADVRTMHFSSLAEMAQEFVNLNSKIVTFRPDDILRGLEPSLPSLRRIRSACPFVGYDMIRRSPNSPMISMATVLRVWTAATSEVPKSGGASAASYAQAMGEDEAEKAARFFNMCYRAWGRDVEFMRLWGALNLAICGWLYRRVVLDTVSTAKRHVRLSGDEYGRALMALSVSDDYLSWLIGRQLNDRDRSPCFGRVKTLIGRRLEAGGKKILLPQPPWAATLPRR
jgi:hypothetical protein